MTFSFLDSDKERANNFSKFVLYLFNTKMVLEVVNISVGNLTDT